MVLEVDYEVRLRYNEPSGNSARENKKYVYFQECVVSLTCGEVVCVCGKVKSKVRNETNTKQNT